MTKNIRVEQLGAAMTDALERQDVHEAIPVTRGDGTVAWVLRVPEAMRDSVAGRVTFAEGPDGHVVAVVQAKHVVPAPQPQARRPVFGAGRGTLTVVGEDDEHLRDFKEYME